MRLILTLELAVVLHAATLVFLSAMHLKAIQRDFSQVLALSEKQINHKAYELVDDVRGEFPSPGEACSVNHSLQLKTVAGILHTTEGTSKNTPFRATHKLRLELSEMR